MLQSLTPHSLHINVMRSVTVKYPSSNHRHGFGNQSCKFQDALRSQKLLYHQWWLTPCLPASHSEIPSVRPSSYKRRFTIISDVSVPCQWRVSSVSVTCQFRVRYQWRVSSVSVTCQFRVSAVRAVSDTVTSSHAFWTEPFTHIGPTERTVLIRNWNVTDKCESTCLLTCFWRYKSTDLSTVFSGFSSFQDNSGVATSNILANPTAPF
jgi:hypothetical protein